MKYRPLIVVVGETASGKSSLAIRLAKQFGGEIICADAWTVYRGFNIGTAKPTKQQQKQIRHHLLDVADPETGFSAAEFKKLATKVIQGISDRGKLPILVGGTGLYVDSILFNYSFLPAGEPKQRKALNKLSLSQLQVRVKNANLDTSGIDIRNKRRLIRLLEASGERPTRSGLRPNTLIIGLKSPRDALKKRITKRTDKMLQTGLEEEVKRLANRFGWNVEPMKGIGYREWQDYFKAKQNLEQTRVKIISSSLKLAKKQRTWFKRNSFIQWVDDPNKAVEIATTFLNKIQ